jgi:hypothetical protein
MSWENKDWGRTREVISSPFYSRHELEVLAGGFCSIHYHRERANRFLIMEGVIEIVEFFGPRYARHQLGPDNTYDVPSLVPHMFIVHRTGTMIEEYYPDRGGKVIISDIVRLVEGGITEDLNELADLPRERLKLIDV